MELGLKEFLKEIQPPFDEPEAIGRHCLHRLTARKVVVTGLRDAPIEDRTNHQLVVDPRNNPDMIQRPSCSNGWSGNSDQYIIIPYDGYKDLSV